MIEQPLNMAVKDELHIEFNYQDEYQKAISLAEQIATKNEERMVG